MMRLYLGNSSKQHHEFYFRVPEDDPRSAPRKMVINSGTQRVLPGEFPREVLDEILSPNLRYGWIEASAVSRARHFAGVIYSFDKPITENALTYIIDANDGRMDDAAMEERQRAANAASNMNPAQDGAEFTPSSFDAEIHQVSKIGGKTTPLEQASVRRNAPPAPRAKGKRAA